MMKGISEEIHSKFLEEVLDLEKKLTEELRRLDAGKAELVERSFSDISRVGVDQRTMSGAQRSEGEAGLAGVTGRRWGFRGLFGDAELLEQCKGISAKRVG